ncbi:copper resistance CopC family protein [Nonomuraea sp. NPDC048882]|uniref:copper resistance CopC family protein n=1 Tax=Nonomuraea sp. NPDC048882 TaxID=3154347 RepID=UPI0034088E71
MKRSPIAALTAMLAAALLVFGAAAPALAHDVLKSSSPAKGAKVTSLDEVRLEFSAKMRMPFVIVRGAGDAQYQSGKPEIDGAVVTQAVDGPLPDGKYTIAYRVVSSDGHPIEGEIPFRVEGATPSPSPSASAEATATGAAPAETPTGTPTGTPAGTPAETGSAAPSAEQSASPPSPAASAPESQAVADRASAGQDASFPVWLIVVIGALVGIGIGFLLSARKKQP